MALKQVREVRDEIDRRVRGVVAELDGAVAPTPPS
jgi:hypothetical protein